MAATIASEGMTLGPETMAMRWPSQTCSKVETDGKHNGRHVAREGFRVKLHGNAHDGVAPNHGINHGNHPLQCIDDPIPYRTGAVIDSIDQLATFRFICCHCLASAPYIPYIRMVANSLVSVSV